MDRERRAVEVGTSGAVPVMRVAFREGIGCIILPPEQTLADIDNLSELTLPLPPGDPAHIPWPDGDLLEVYAMKQVLGGENAYAEFPRRALLDRICMRNTLVSTDRFGDFILSSQVYTNASDLARFDLLYLNEGVWNSERIVSEE